VYAVDARSSGARRTPRAHHSPPPSPSQRRCYWLLDGDEGLVLVHYLSVAPPPSSRGPAGAAAGALARSASAPAGASPAGGGATFGLPHGVTHEPGPNGVTVTTGLTGAARRREETVVGAAREATTAGDGGHPVAAPSPFASADLAPFDPPPAHPRPLAVARAATAPAAWRALARGGRVPSGSLGPLHAAPSWSGATVSTGETLDAAAAAAAAAGEAEAAAAPVAQRPPPPFAPALRLSAASRASALEAALARTGGGDGAARRGVKRRAAVCE